MPAPANPPQSAKPSLFSVPGYGRWFTADTLVALASGVVGGVLPILVLVATGSRELTATVAAAAAVGQLTAALVGGHLADLARRRVVGTTALLCSAVLIGAFEWLMRVGGGDVWFVAVCATALAVSSAVAVPAINVTLRHLMPATVLPRALGLNQQRDIAMALAIPPLAATAVAVQPTWTLLVAAVTMLIGAIAFVRVPQPAAEQPSDAPRESPWAAMTAGFRCIVKSADMTILVVVAAVGNFAASAAMFTLILHLHDIGSRPSTIGLVQTSVGVSMLIGTVVAGAFTARLGVGQLIAWGMVLAGGVLAVVTLVGSAWAMLVVLVAAFISLPAGQVASQTYISVVSPKDALGRVMTALGMCSLALSPLVGPLALASFRAFGWQTTMFVATCLLVAAGLLALLNGRLRALPKLTELTTANT